MLYYLIIAGLACLAYPLAVLFAARARSRQMADSVPLLLPGERPEVLAAATEASCQLAGDGPWLTSFLDRYLGTATAAKQEAWDRCRTDPQYLRLLVSDNLSRQRDEALLLTLVGSKVPPPKGIDPNERLARHRAAGALFTPAQGIAALVGAAIIALMLLMPPWMRRNDDITWFMFTVKDYRVDGQEFLGYRPVFGAGWPKDTYKELSTGDLGKVRFKRTQYVIVASLLAVQIAVVGIAALTAVWLLRRPPMPRVVV